MTDTPKNARPLPEPWKLCEPFWEAARDGRLMIQFDPVVKKYQFYPRSVSIYTGRRNLEWREVSGKGSLYSFTDIHVAPPGFEDLAPYMIGVIELAELTELRGLTGLRRLPRLLKLCKLIILSGLHASPLPHHHQGWGVPRRRLAGFPGFSKCGRVPGLRNPVDSEGLVNFGF